jgi:hypothetical protein
MQRSDAGLSHAIERRTQGGVVVQRADARRSRGVTCGREAESCNRISDGWQCREVEAGMWGWAGVHLHYHSDVGLMPPSSEYAWG